jgi:hypothetical protein
MEHADKLNGAMNEIVSAMSALNMEPSPIPAVDDEMRFLSESDAWAKHCMEHLEAAFKLLVEAVKERDARRVPVLDFRESRDGKKIGDAVVSGDRMTANITDPDAIADLKAGTRRGVSVGYTVTGVVPTADQVAAAEERLGKRVPISHADSCDDHGHSPEISCNLAGISRDERDRELAKQKTSMRESDPTADQVVAAGDRLFKGHAHHKFGRERSAWPPPPARYGPIRDGTTGRIIDPGTPRKPPSGTYQHAEAFCFMLYRDTRGNEEWIWNSRDGVTPYGVRSREGYEATHAEWHRDRCDPEHVPAVGDRIFVDLTIERAREHRRAYVERWWDSAVHGQRLCDRFSTRQTAIEALAVADFEEGGGATPDLIEVTAEMVRSRHAKQEQSPEKPDGSGGSRSGHRQEGGDPGERGQGLQRGGQAPAGPEGDAHTQEAALIGGLDLVKLRAIAVAAIGTPHNPHPQWHVEPNGRTVWSGRWPETEQQHPICTYRVDNDPRGVEAPPIGTHSTMLHIAANSPDVTIRLIDRIRDLERLLDLAAAGAKR